MDALAIGIPRQRGDALRATFHQIHLKQQAAQHTTTITHQNYLRRCQLPIEHIPKIIMCQQPIVCPLLFEINLVANTRE